MGNRFEVYAYVPAATPEGYEYQQVHGGQRLLPALAAAYRAKRAGAGCVKVEWR